MYHLKNLSACLETVYVLSTKSESTKPKSLAELKKNFQQFLKQMQPEVPSSTQNDLWYINDDAAIKSLCEIFNADTTLTDISFKLDESKISDIGNRTEHYTTLKNHLSLLKSLDPELSAVFELAVNACFQAPAAVAGGGTTSGAIGVLWLDARPNWTAQDYLEYCVHELTHTLMFLDELRFQHYVKVKALSEKESFAQSAILRRLRPLDKVIHALVVSTEVLSFRQKHKLKDQKLALHPPTEIMIDGALKSIKSIKSVASINKYVTQRYLDLVDQCEDKLLSLNLTDSKKECQRHVL